MADGKDIINIWKNSPYKPPSVPFAVISSPLKEDGKLIYKTETLLVVSDEGNYYSFINAQGEVFYISKNLCLREGNVYNCSGPLYSTGCIIEEDKVNFARKELVPLFYDINMI